MKKKDVLKSIIENIIIIFFLVVTVMFLRFLGIRIFWIDFTAGAVVTFASIRLIRKLQKH